VRAGVVQRVAEASARQGRRADAEKEDDVRADPRAARVQPEESAARAHELRRQEHGALLFGRQLDGRAGHADLGRLHDLPPDLLSALPQVAQTKTHTSLKYTILHNISLAKDRDSKVIRTYQCVCVFFLTHVAFLDVFLKHITHSLLEDVSM
jgi:hypothetical protein